MANAEKTDIVKFINNKGIVLKFDVEDKKQAKEFVNKIDNILEPVSKKKSKKSQPEGDDKKKESKTKDDDEVPTFNNSVKSVLDSLDSLSKIKIPLPKTHRQLAIKLIEEAEKKLSALKRKLQDTSVKSKK